MLPWSPQPGSRMEKSLPWCSHRYRRWRRPLSQRRWRCSWLCFHCWPGWSSCTWHWLDKCWESWVTPPFPCVVLRWGCPHTLKLRITHKETSIHPCIPSSQSMTLSKRQAEPEKTKCRVITAQTTLQCRFIGGKSLFLRRNLHAGIMTVGIPVCSHLTLSLQELPGDLLELPPPLIPPPAHLEPIVPLTLMQYK